MLCGLLPTSEGDAIVDGKSIIQHPQAVKQMINISPQETAVAPNLTVYENLLLIGQIYGYEKTDKTATSAGADGFIWTNNP